MNSAEFLRVYHFLVANVRLCACVRACVRAHTLTHARTDIPTRTHAKGHFVFIIFIILQLSAALSAANQRVLYYTTGMVCIFSIIELEQVFVYFECFIRHMTWDFCVFLRARTPITNTLSETNSTREHWLYAATTRMSSTFNAIKHYFRR